MKKYYNLNEKNISVRAGLIPYYRFEEFTYFCVILTHKDTIEFSKGHLLYCEESKQTAIREAYEELGYKRQPYHKIKFLISSNKIDYFIVEINPNEINSWKRPVWKSEIKSVLWLEKKELENKLIDWQKDILIKILEIFP